MIATLVHIWVKKPFVDAFVRETIENHLHTVKEPGNLRFDFLGDARDPCKFTLYEVFESPAAVDDHKKTAHYLKWKETVAEWMEQPRQGVPHHVIYPTDPASW